RGHPAFGACPVPERYEGRACLAVGGGGAVRAHRRARPSCPFRGGRARLPPAGGPAPLRRGGGAPAPQRQSQVRSLVEGGSSSPSPNHQGLRRIPSLSTTARLLCRLLPNSITNFRQSEANHSEYSAGNFFTSSSDRVVLAPTTPTVTSTGLSKLG